jgi:hypothetical protein
MSCMLHSMHAAYAQHDACCMLRSIHTVLYRAWLQMCKALLTPKRLDTRAGQMARLARMARPGAQHWPVDMAFACRNSASMHFYMSTCMLVHGNAKFTIFGVATE